MVDYNNPPPVCHLCEKFYTPLKNGIDVFLMTGVDNNEIYIYWRADVYECPECHVQIITRFGAPQHYFENKEKIKAIYKSAKMRGTIVEVT